MSSICIAISILDYPDHIHSLGQLLREAMFARFGIRSNARKIRRFAIYDKKVLAISPSLRIHLIMYIAALFEIVSQLKSGLQRETIIFYRSEGR